MLAKADLNARMPEDAHRHRRCSRFCVSIFGRVEHLRAVAEATDASEAHNVALFGWDGERVSSKHHDLRGNTRTFAMTNKTACQLVKSFAAFVLIATLSSATFAGEFTVEQGKRYRATLHLNSVERLVDNALIESKFRALGFSGVRVSGTGATRRVEGVWPRKDASAPLPPEIVAVARL